MMNRRQFLVSSAVLAGARLSAAPKYDLVIKGGRVLDVSQRLDRVMDVAVRGGKIAALESSIAASDGAEVFDATGKLVTPGLVDIHAHPRPGEVTPQQILSNGVTTVVDGGTPPDQRNQHIHGDPQKAPKPEPKQNKKTRQAKQPTAQLHNK